MLLPFEPIIARLRSFGLARLAFAVVTLAMTLSGTIANYALSSNALRHFDTLLELDNSETFVVSGANYEVDAMTDGAFDPEGLARIGPELIAGLLPPGFTVTAFRIFPVTVEGGGSVQLAKAYAVGDGFARQTGLTTDMPAGFETDGLMQDSCLVGSGLAESLGGGSTVWVEGKACRVAGHFHAPVRPPFAELSRSLLIADREDSFEQVDSGNFNFLVTGPAESLPEPRLKGLLSLVFDVSRLTFWSSAPIIEQARELKFIAMAISVGLSAIILMIGGVSIAALMSFSVTERRREIAIRRTLGATRARIVVEIVQETVLIAVLALVVGIVGGMILADVLQQPLSRYFVAGSITGSGIALGPIARAVTGFFVVTLIAGIVPALNAARTDPATVLRES
ncbi:ABC transporter permease [Martelella sp. FLE1502]